jgi:hypothetical protein
MGQPPDEGFEMTDKQRELFQKMAAGKVWKGTRGSFFYIKIGNAGMCFGLSDRHPEWNDYEAARKEYRQAPLIKALS